MLKRISPTFDVFTRCFSTARGSVAATTTSSTHITLESVRSLCANGLISEAFSQFYALDDAPFDAPTYLALFHACARHRHLRFGEALHRQMLARHPNRPFDLRLDNHIVNMYAKCGQLDHARYVFDGMPKRNIVSWTALVSGYSQYDRPDECFSIFVEMMEYFHPTDFAYASVLSCCVYDQGRQVHALALKSSFDAYTYVANALIAMYFKNVGARGEENHEALAVFRGVESRDLVSWNSMIGGFQACGLWAKALVLFNQMHREGIGFDRASLLSTISSLCNIDDDNVHWGLQYCLQMHSLSLKTGLIKEVEVATVLVRAHSNLGGVAGDYYRIFLETENHRDIVCWTETITAFAEQNPQKSLFLFLQLLREGVALDRYSLLSVLRACSSLMTEQHTSAIHLLVMIRGFERDILLVNALIHCYSRCGSLCMSRQVFDEAKLLDIVSWNSMLKAYALHGQSKEALELYSKMNLPPDSTTYVSLLAACSHSGMVQEGAKIFDDMSKTYGIVPELDHYACMVDLYGRAGLIQQAENLIREMPMEPDSVVWISLLGACRKHNETRLAELAAAKLRELDPDNSLGYVLMSNIYFSDGSFNEALLLRKKMTGSKVRKNPGLSWIEG